MAMELNSKQLHKHAVPVVIILAVLLVAAAGVSQDLFTRVIKIQPSPNGLAKVTIDRSEPTSLNHAAEAGRSASLSINFH